MFPSKSTLSFLGQVSWSNSQKNPTLDGKPLICGGMKAFNTYSAECYVYQHWNLGRSLWPYWSPLLPKKMDKERGGAGYVTMNDGSLWITGNLF